MTYYLIFKSNKKWQSNTKITLKDGYEFHQRIKITLYDYQMINYIFNKKITKYLQEIINLFLLYEDDEDGREGILVPKIETLRRLIIEKYSRYLTEGEIESYLTKCDKIEYKTISRKKQKSRSM